jgi:release factor glutamine methyltransferase
MSMQKADPVPDRRANVEEGAGRTIIQILNSTRDFLEKKGVASARLEAEVLMAFVMGCDRVGVYMNFDKPMSGSELDALRDLVVRRGKREPLAHITGRREFWSIQFKITPAVLIPRQDTEILVEESLRLLKEIAEPEILEIGTGSGAIAVSLARELPGAKITATDISGEIISLARENAASAGVAERIKFLKGVDLEPVKGTGSRYDLVISNPPYIPGAEIETLEPEVRAHEPRSALDGGVDGLEIIRKISSGAGGFLKPGGWILIESGDSTWAGAKEVLLNDGYKEVAVIKDYSGLNRAVKGRTG